MSDTREEDSKTAKKSGGIDCRSGGGRPEWQRRNNGGTAKVVRVFVFIALVVVVCVVSVWSCSQASHTRFTGESMQYVRCARVLVCSCVRVCVCLCVCVCVECVHVVRTLPANNRYVGSRHKHQTIDGGGRGGEGKHGGDDSSNGGGGSRRRSKRKERRLRSPSDASIEGCTTSGDEDDDDASNEANSSEEEDPIQQLLCVDGVELEDDAQPLPIDELVGDKPVRAFPRACVSACVSACVHFCVRFCGRAFLRAFGTACVCMRARVRVSTLVGWLVGE